MITCRNRYLRAANILYIVFLLIQLIPDTVQDEKYVLYAVGFVSIIEGIFLIYSTVTKDINKNIEIGKIIFVIYFVLASWVILGAKTGILNDHLFPAPGIVFHQFFVDFQLLMESLASSLRTIFTGYILAIILGVPMGLFLGWNKYIGVTASYIIRFLSAIPPIVFIPYAIALLPSFGAASIFVIFIAAYWPILSGTMNGVLNVEKGILDSAKVLNVSTGSLLGRVIFPAALPHIFVGSNQGLGVAFILLTSAEMIGGNVGLGYYIRNYSDFGDFKRVILGIIFVGIVVCLISFGMKKLQNYLLRWKV